MKRRGFIINSTVLVLLIPLLLLLATYSNVTSYVLQAQSQAARLKTTQDVVSYLQFDLQNVMRLSLKRALVLSIAFVTTVEPLDNAQLALESLVKYGSYSQINSAGADWISRERQFMGNATLLDWLNNMRDYLATMGYRMVTPPSQILNDIRLTIAPLDSFHIVANITIPQIVIEDSSGKIVYNSSIPPTGSLYVVVPVTNLEDPLISYLTKGRLSRVIVPCKFAYPNITPPYYLVNGYGDPQTKPLKFAAPFASAISSDAIYYGDTYPGGGALAYVLKEQPTTTPSSAFVFDTRVNGSLISPASVFNDGDMGVMVFSGRVGAGTSWCNDNYQMKAGFTLSGVSDGQIVLLKFNPSSVPFSQIRHNGAYADMAIYTSSCTLANYWIEKWDSNEILIWLKVTGTSYSIYYSSDGTQPLSRGQLYYVFGDNYTENVDLSPGQSMFLFNTDSPVFVRYNASASANSDFGGGVELNVPALVPSNVLKVSIDYPYTVSDVQVPIYLNSTWASRIPHSGNEAQIEVYSDSGLTQRLPFWIEYWNDNGALIWVRTSVPGDVYIKFGDDLPLTRGDGDEVFLFFDDFTEQNLQELSQKWAYNPDVTISLNPSGNGTLEISGGDSIIALRTKNSLNINVPFAIEFRMKPNFEAEEDWDAGIGLADYYVLNSGNSLLLFTDDITADYLAQHRAWWGGEVTSPDSRGDYEFHTYSVEVVSTGYAYDSYWARFRFSDLSRTSRDATLKWWTFRFPLSYLYLVIDSESANRGAVFDWIFIRKYLNLADLDESISRVYTPEPISFQLVDNWTTAGRLFILQDWGTTLASYSTGTWPINVPNRYEVDVVPSSTGLFLNYTHNPNSVIPENSRTVVDVSIAGDVGVYLTVRNSAGNSAHFSWVFWGPYPYAVLSPLVGVPEQKPPEGNYVTARVFDIQPFRQCVIDERYFGVAGAPSFFERLEGGSSAHRAHYISLAEAMQRAVYGGVRYPIGLVSFILPKNLPANLNFLVREQPAVDYIYLDYADYPGDDPDAMQVLGISATGGITSTPVLDQNFYLTPATASLIFGPYANDLLVPIGSG
ncbi:conserved protein of unknown function [Thermococcus nautili]|uniref:DUF2341 domain-containing protein n=1 Tax=Thermococcus nautili TaxID=195522 RepID=UPI0025553366|nr:DUF2341 domain-containing protein [Thermococcus nautili]CAI1492406.1 conserved protein of unknown function [Thermococcus nautili]